MKNRVLLLTLALPLVIGSQIQAQEDAGDVFNQRLYYVDTHPGKTQEWRQLVRDVSMKVAQKQADKGEIISWTLLRSVYPAGAEARSDFLISIISAGNPKPRENTYAEDMEIAGVKMTSDEYFEKRDAISELVASELWEPIYYNGAAEKGNFIALNMMHVKDWATISRTTEMWSPISQEFIDQGGLTAWVFATKTFPSGTETPYPAYSANIYPNLEAVFGTLRMSDVFSKVHPGKDIDVYRGMLGRARDIANRELWTILERITKSD